MPTRHPIWLVLLALALWVPAARAATATSPSSAVLSADTARIEAMLAADTEALEPLLTDDCLYVHSYGGTQTKPELLAALRNGTMKYRALRYTAPPQIRFYDRTTAVLTGTVRLEVATPDGKVLKPTLVITAVYIQSSNRWQLASYQSTNSAGK